MAAPWAVVLLCFANLPVSEAWLTGNAGVISRMGGGPASLGYSGREMVRCVERLVGSDAWRRRVQPAGGQVGVRMVLAEDSNRATLEGLGKETTWMTSKGKGHQQAMAVGQKDLSVFQEVDRLGELLGGRGKAKMVWESLKVGTKPWEDEERVTEKARKLLQSSFLDIPAVAMESVSSDSTTKLLVQLSDGLQVESVVIPNTGRQSASGAVEARTTLCVSSQVGCNRACDFCATGKMGFIRQLSAHEILSQVFHGLRVVRERNLPRINNIVFMGMGEPLNNPLNVLQATQILTSDRCFGFARSKVTVSTVGPSPAAIRAAGDMPAMLAWSVHAADDELRKRLVPTTAHSMVELRDTFRDVLTKRSASMSTFMVAVTLISGLNDGAEHADELVELLQPLKDSGIKGLCVDLIPYNDIGEGGYVRVDKERLFIFQRRLRDAGFACFVRVTRGDDDNAACGQLVTKVEGKGRAGKAVSAQV